MNRYKTDFNDLTDDGLATALAGWEGGSVVLPNAPDELVELFDGDCNTCLGLVDRIDQSNGLIYVRPVWDSWQDAPESTLPDLADALLTVMRAEREGRITSTV